MKKSCRSKIVSRFRAGVVQRISEDETGGVLPLIAVILVAIFVIMAFVIDIPSEEFVARQLQAAADAAALAAAGELDGTNAGFSRAKKVAIAVLKQNPVKGASQELGDGFSLDGGTIYNAALDGTGYSGTTGTSGNLEVTVERGIYWAKADNSGYEFMTLEADSSGKKYGLPLYLFGNAVRVSLRISGIDTIFATVLGIGKFQALTRSSNAVNDSEIERNVAPFAVRACDLLLDVNPSRTTGEHFTDSYQAPTQCTRNSILFTSPNWENAATDNVNVTPPYDVSDAPNTAGRLRREGYWRFISYRRPPTYDKAGAGNDVCFPSGTNGGKYLNCKALPMQGVLGIPGTSDTKSTPAELISALSGTPMLAKLGQPFRPLEDPTDLWNASKGLRANEILAAWINGGSDLVANKLFAGAAPKTQFPWLRTTGPVADPNLFTRIFWPDPTNGNEKMSFLMGEYTNAQWTNPMCHAAGVAVNNKATAKARTVWVPVLAATEKKAGADMLYCDWEKIFADRNPGSVPVLSGSKPRIIGYVKVNAYDGNFLDLDRLFPPAAGLRATPIAYDPAPSHVQVKDGNPVKIEMSGDKLPALHELKEKLHEFRDQHEEYFNCVDHTHGNCSGSKPSVPNLGSFFDRNSWYAKCFQFFDGPTPAFGGGGFVTTAAGRYGTLNSTLLTSTQTCPPRQACTRTYGWGGGAKDKFHTFFDDLDAILDQPIAAKPGVHCMPLPKPNQYDLDSADSWVEMGPRAAGVGCGGISATLDSCAADINLSTGKTRAEGKPALVN